MAVKEETAENCHCLFGEGEWRMKRREKVKKAILWAFIMAVLGAVVPRRMKHDL